MQVAASRHFAPVRRADFPRLAWVFELAQRPVAHCGADVELSDLGLVEGCWDGSFAAFDFADRSNLFGSGVVRHKGEWLFCPPCHTLEALYLLVKEGRAQVGNSLVPLLAQAGLGLDPKVGYTRALGTLVAGIDAATALIWRDRDVALYRILYDNFTVTRDGSPQRRRKVATGPFVDFAGYRDHLLATIEACAANAADPARRRRSYHRLVSTCSSGYDSATVTALAAAAGGELVLSLRAARDDREDSGRPVADALGLPCVERERNAAATAGRELEWLTPGTGGGDYPLAVFEPELSGGAVLLTGFHGDKVWGRTVPPSAVLKRGDPSGASIADFRLRVGFLHLPVPFIGALRHAEIHRISQAEEMRPWSVGGDYDRPICRRILEEAGVPRGLVGRHKRAIATHFSRDMRLISSETRAAFQDELRATAMLGGVRRELLGFRTARAVFRVLRKAIKVAPALERPLGGLRDRLDGRFRARENSRYANLLFIWAIRRSLATQAPASAVRAAAPAEAS